jgi:hypothetical protein
MKDKSGSAETIGGGGGFDASNLSRFVRLEEGACPCAEEEESPTGAAGAL